MSSDATTTGTTGVPATPSAPDPVATRTPARLAVAFVVLLAADLAGGLLAVATSVNTWGEAWGPAALLAAPLPMIAGQAVLTYLSTRTRRRWGAVPAGLLALACLVSVVSGFFDGGLGNDELDGWLTAYQVLLLSVTALVGLLALQRARELLAGGRTRA